MQERARVVGARVVDDWQSQLPAGSRWRPGDVGKPNCPTCFGVGYVSVNVNVGHPLFGKALVCDCQEADHQSRIVAKLRGQSSLMEDDFRLRWSSIRQIPEQAQIRAAIERALANRYGWVFAWGAPGVGKSLILKTAVSECIIAQTGAVYARWDEILDHLRQGYGKNEYDERLEMWQSVGILCIDELGRERETDWGTEQAHKLIDKRYRAFGYRKCVTIFSSNFAPTTFDNSLASRFTDARGEVVKVGGVDLRSVKR